MSKKTSVNACHALSPPQRFPMGNWDWEGARETMRSPRSFVFFRFTTLRSSTKEASAEKTVQLIISKDDTTLLSLQRPTSSGRYAKHHYSCATRVFWYLWYSNVMPSGIKMVTIRVFWNMKLTDASSYSVIQPCAIWWQRNKQCQA